MRMDLVDYQIFGDDMQYVEIELDPGEAAVGEAGAMYYMQDGVTMEPVFGDGSGQQQGMLDGLLGAGRRLLSGESLFTTVFSNRAASKKRVAFAAPSPGKIVAVSLAEQGGTLLAQRDSFLCAARGVRLGMAFQKRIGAGLFGGEGFILQKLEGDGAVFLHAGGTLTQYSLAAGEVLRVDTGCLVAFQPSVDFSIEYVGKLKTALFAGEGLFFARLSGPGTVWLQSFPLARLADRIISASPKASGSQAHGQQQSLLGGWLSRRN